MPAVGPTAARRPLPRGGPRAWRGRPPLRGWPGGSGAGLRHCRGPWGQLVSRRLHPDPPRHAARRSPTPAPPPRLAREPHVETPQSVRPFLHWPEGLDVLHGHPARPLPGRARGGQPDALRRRHRRDLRCLCARAALQPAPALGRAGPRGALRRAHRAGHPHGPREPRGASEPLQGTRTARAAPLVLRDHARHRHARAGVPDRAPVRFPLQGRAGRGPRPDGGGPPLLAGRRGDLLRRCRRARCPPLARDAEPLAEPRDRSPPAIVR